MNKFLLAMTLALAMSVPTLPIWANPVQKNTGNGSPNQAQVYGDGSAAQSQSAKSRSTSRSSATGGTATGGNATGGSSSVINQVSGGGGSAGGGLGLSVPEGFGMANCGGGVGLGGLGLSGGGSAGGSLFEFGDCKRMREASFLLGMGYRQAAINELCQIGRVLEAFGGTCPTIEAATVVQPEADTTVYNGDYCMTRNAGDKDQHRECDHQPKIRKK